MKFEAVKYARSIGYHYASIKASYAGMDVMLFFYRKGNGSWNALISTDTGIDAKEADMSSVIEALDFSSVCQTHMYRRMNAN